MLVILYCIVCRLKMGSCRDAGGTLGDVDNWPSRDRGLVSLQMLLMRLKYPDNSY